jgi:hypothetical protein
MDDNRRFPNLFWPIIFIGVGALYLMANLGLIEAVDFRQIWRLWPVFLVIAGINMLFGRNTRWLASMLSGLLALLVVAFLFFAPTIMDTYQSAELTSETFSEPLDGAESANVSLDFDYGTIFVNALEDNTLLFAAEVTHDQEATYHSSGSDQRNIRLDLNQLGLSAFGSFLDQANTEARVGLAAGVPTELKVDIGGGSAEMDLSDLDLERLTAGSGSGNLEAILPPGNYPVKLSSGSGSITVQTGSGSELNLNVDVGSGRIVVELGDGSSGEVELDSGSGSITVILPEGMAVRISGDTGSGSVSVPSDFVRLSGGDDLVGAGGTWQTEGFNQADEQLFIEFDVGSGSIRVKYQ